MWWGDGGAYFVALLRAHRRTAARPSTTARSGSSTRATDTIELKLHFAYTPADQDNDPDGPDNITVSAYGGVIIAEDGEGKQHLVGRRPSAGEAFFFARNDDPRNAEFTGPTFSHDSRTLFANVQSPGYVYAIRGPFRKQHC